MTPPVIATFVTLILFVFVGYALGLWMIRDHEERLASIEDDLAVDLRAEIEATRALGAIRQRDVDLALLNVLGFDDDRIVEAEWTRPDWIDERVPEPHRNRNIVPW